MLSDYFKQDVQLFTLTKTYTPTPAKGQARQEIQCTAILPITVDRVAGLKKKDSSVVPIADESGEVTGLLVTGIKASKFLHL